MIKKLCINGNLNELLNISSEKSTKKHRIFSDKDKNQSKKLKLTASTSASTFTSIKSFDKKLGKNIRKHEKNIKSKDLGYIIPLNIDNNITYLKKSRNISDYYKICNDNNNFIYQVINNELYIIVSILKNFFNTNHKQELLDNLSKNLNCVKKNFKNEIEYLFNKKNKRHTYTLYGGCNTMQGHPNYAIPTKDEKYCHIAEFIQNYLTNELCNFEDLKSKDLYDNFRNSIPLNQMVDIKKCHFDEILKSENRFKFYLYLKNQLFPLIIKLESLVAKLIQCSFPELYSLFNIDIPNIETNLSFFKSFAINFSILEETDQLNIKRQGAIDPHKDMMDCLYSFCIVVIFEDFEGGNIILSKIDVVIEIEDGYIIILKSAFLEYFNLHILKNRFSIVFYLRKTFYSEI